MAQKDVKACLIGAEDLIRSGRAGEGANLLLAFLAQSFPSQASRRALEPAVRAQIIQLLRRSGASQTALEFGYDAVRGELSELTPASSGEKLEYAAALIFAGIEDEGLSLLDEVPRAHSSFVHLYRAFGLFPRWDYEKAEPELERFLARTDKGNYFYLVGQINRASCLVLLERLDEAEPLLLEVIEKTQSAESRFLRSNALELLAQFYLKREALSKAESALEEAKALFPDAGSLYRLFIDKWAYVLSLKRWPHAEDWHGQAFLALLERARRIGHHETVRDLYLQTALTVNDERQQKLLRVLSGGTPHQAYRDRVKSHVNGPDEKVLVTFGAGAFHEAWSLDSAETLPIWSRPLADRKFTRLLQILASDLFSPWRVPRLFQALFPGRFYDAKSARNLLHQSVHELRRGLEREGHLPLAVEWKDGQIFLRLHSPLAIELGSIGEDVAGSLLDARALQLLREIESRFGERPFAKAELEAHIEIPKRTVQRYLQNLVQSKALTQIGGGRAVRYRRVRMQTE
jgi:tetratricopeptide (TPR) repeat protein